MIFPKTIANLPSSVRREFDFSISSVNPISGISIIIPVRGSDRQNNLNYCITRLLMQNVEPIEIIVSEEDQIEKINLKYFINDSRIRKIFTQSGPTPFNKSIAINAGCSVATYNKILMNDVDIVVPRGYLARINFSLNQYDSCFFGKEIYNVMLLKSGLLWNGSKRVDYFSGGSIAFTKNSFAKIGGMCEKFYGYGSEDCEFWGRITGMTNICEARDTIFLHLEHKRANSYSVNVKVYEEIMNIPIEQRLVSLRYDLQKRTGWSYNINV